MIAINGIELPEPVDIKTTDEDIVKKRTTASGRTVIDYITTKKVVNVTWGKLTDSEAQQIIDTININKPFFTLSFIDAGGPTLITAYAEKIQRSIQSVYNGEIIWAGMQITFKER